MVLKDGKNYADNAKAFVINMVSETRTLHKKNGCYYSHHLSKYYDFDTLEEAGKSGIDFQKCRICFRLDNEYVEKNHIRVGNNYGSADQ